MALRIATRGSALALAQAGQVAEMLGGAELVEVSSDGEPGDKARFVRGVEQALLDGEAEIGVHSAKDLPAELPEGLCRRRCRRARTRATPGSAPAARSRSARGGPGRDREPAPARAAARRCGPTSR